MTFKIQSNAHDDVSGVVQIALHKQMGDKHAGVHINFTATPAEVSPETRKARAKVLLQEALAAL